MKKLIYILVVITVIGAMAFTLMNNKKEMAAKAAVAEIKSDAISVSLTEPQTARIDKSFTAQGNFKPIQSLVLLSETQGQIKQVFKRKGDRVRAGELLLQVEANTMNADLSAKLYDENLLNWIERVKIRTNVWYGGEGIAILIRKAFKWFKPRTTKCSKSNGRPAFTYGRRG
jgi:multidrug efflux pump subunit AcrA (membrane-fusion protein)